MTYYAISKLKVYKIQGMMIRYVISMAVMHFMDLSIDNSLSVLC
jgi:hypothetical protein